MKAQVQDRYGTAEILELHVEDLIRRASDLDRVREAHFASVSGGRPQLARGRRRNVYCAPGEIRGLKGYAGSS